MDQFLFSTEFHEALSLSFMNLIQAEDPFHHLMVSYQTCWSRTTKPETFDCEKGKTTGFSNDSYNCDPLCKY